MFDSIIISDLHLGSDACQKKQLLKFLQLIEKEEIQTKKLIINGDFFDNLDFRRLKKYHWNILSTIRKMSDRIEIVLIVGNHEGHPAEIISHLLGVEVMEEFILESEESKILILHGHKFDDFIADHPIVVRIADWIYHLLQKIHIYWAKNTKKYSKTFLRCAEKIEKKAIDYAKKKNCNIVCCGHSHLEAAKTGEISYFNSGCWTELPCSYLTVEKGQIKLNHFFMPQDKAI